MRPRRTFSRGGPEKDSVSRDLLRDLSEVFGLPPAPQGETNAAKAQQHHRPGARLGDRITRYAHSGAEAVEPGALETEKRVAERNRARISVAGEQEGELTVP